MRHRSLDLTQSTSLIRFNPHWLRFNCSLCKDKSSGQRTIANGSVPHHLTIKNASISDKNVMIEWNEDSKQMDSQLPLSFLINHHPVENRTEEKFKPCTVNYRMINYIFRIT